MRSQYDEPCHQASDVDDFLHLKENNKHRAGDPPYEFLLKKTPASTILRLPIFNPSAKLGTFL